MRWVNTVRSRPLGARTCRVTRLAATALLAASISAAANVAQATTLVAEGEVYPFVEEPPPAVGMPPIRRIRTTSTSIGVEAVADRILVQFDPSATSDLAQIHQRAATLGAGVARPVLVLDNGAYLIDVTGASSVEAAAAAYQAADPRVVGASPDGMFALSAAPSDPLYPDQVEKLDPIGVSTAWHRAAAWDGSRGAVRIAILDTGIDESHPDLAGKVENRVNVTHFGSGANDEVGHGTAVAGIAAAVTNNMLGIAGIGYDARLLNVKVGSVSTSASAIARGIYWAVNHGADVINLSTARKGDCDPWWTSEFLDIGVASLRDAIEYARLRNVIVVAAAGNSGNTDKHFPASCPNVLSVASWSVGSIEPEPFSTRGLWVDVATPGRDVLTTTARGTQLCRSHPTDVRYSYCTGTSMSAPMVSGVAALVRASCKPESAQASIDRITRTAYPFGGTGVYWQFGTVYASGAVCVPAPSGLTNIGASATPSPSFTFRWHDLSLNERNFLFSYQRFGATTWTATSLPANTTQYTVSGLETGAVYNFKVQACDGQDCSIHTHVLTLQANFPKLRVTRRGGGKVSSSPAGINCSPTSTKCEAQFLPGSQVILTAVGAIDALGNEYDFHHWEGACGGTSISCTVTMNQAINATAVFVKVGNSPPSDL